jgi:hypothetical protein
MPFLTNADTPPEVQARHAGHCLTVWREVYNDTFYRHGDEGRAFATAETAAKQCEASKMTDLTAVKFVDGSDTLIEGLAIPFGGPKGGKDLDDEDFGPDTDFVFDMYPHGRPLIYEHGMDKGAKVAVQGRQTEHDVIDEGVWAQAQLDKSAKYHATVARMIAKGQLYFSSGTAPQMVDIDASGHIKQWPWMELSLTPRPANPLAVVHAVKAAQHIDYLNAAGLDVPAELIAKALKAFDQTDDSPPDPVADPTYAELTESVAAQVKAWAQATEDRIAFRAKDGRTLSDANLGALREAHGLLTAALKEAERTPESLEEARRLYAEYLQIESRIAGVPV